MTLRVLVIVVLAVAMISAGHTSSYCADKTDQSKAPRKIAPAPAVGNMMRNFSVIAGTVTSINTSDPVNSYAEVKSDVDGSVQKFAVMPWTSVVKISELADIKTGEPVRVMAQSGPEKTTAISITFGKFKALPRPPTVYAGQGPMKSATPSKNTPKQ